MEALRSFKTLTAIDNSSMVDKVELSLLDFFAKKELKVGDSIPKELELAEILGVSRTVVRETLTRLRTMGLIETRKKKGTVIKSPDITHILQKSIIPHIFDDNTLKDIFEMMNNTKGVILQDDIANQIYPMPMNAHRTV